MKPSKHYSEALAFALLQLILPKSIKEDICGDLHEEFAQLQHHPTSKTNATKWLWSQTLSCCWRFIVTKQRVFSAMLAALCCLVVFKLLVAINFLSVADSADFNRDYWTNGNVHQLFFEPTLWQSINAGLLSQFSLGMILHPYAILYAVLSLLAVLVIDKKRMFSTSVFAPISLGLMALPYLGGVLYFKFNDVALNQSGPVIALMWLSILYLMPPLTYRLISKRHQLA